MARRLPPHMHVNNMEYSLLQNIETVGIIVLGAGYVYAQFFRGKNGRTKDEIDTENALVTYLKTQNEGFKAITKEQDDKINAMSKEIAVFKATIAEKDSTIEKYLALLENRDPQLKNFMENMTATAKNSDAFMKGQVAIMGEIKNFMQAINAHMEKEFKIESTITQKT